MGALLFLMVMAAAQGVSDAERLAHEGIGLFREGRFPEAETALAQALKLEPANLAARLYLSRTLVSEDKVPEALRQLGLLLEFHAGNPEAEFQAGQLLQDLAESRFARLQKLAPGSAETHELLGKVYEARGKLKQALAEYRLALERDPSGPGLHFLVGNIYWKLGEFDAALPELQAELRLNPNHSMANHRVGHIYVSRHAPAEAIPYLERAIGGAPDFIEAHRDLGKAFRLEGRYREALAELRFVAEQRPDDTTVHAQLAAVYRALGDSARAREELKLHEQILEKRRQAAQRR
jgi:tetratricopeptide (TPR) repeat protein